MPDGRNCYDCWHGPRNWTPTSIVTCGKGGHPMSPKTARRSVDDVPRCSEWKPGWARDWKEARDA